MTKFLISIKTVSEFRAIYEGLTWGSSYESNQISEFAPISRREEVQPAGGDSPVIRCTVSLGYGILIVTSDADEKTLLSFPNSIFCPHVRMLMLNFFLITLVDISDYV